jgi:hypothetical protein
VDTRVYRCSEEERESTRFCGEAEEEEEEEEEEEGEEEPPPPVPDRRRPPPAGGMKSGDGERRLDEDLYP